MPKTKSAKKRLRSSHKKFLRNKALRSNMKTAIKRAELALESGDVEEAKRLYNYASSAIDKAKSKGAIHKNKASREKSKLGKKLAELTE